MPYDSLWGIENLFEQLMGFTEYKILTLFIVIVILILIILYLTSRRV